MSIELLREAAAKMRDQHGPDHERHAMWSAMATLLDDTAETWEMCTEDDLFRRAISNIAVYYTRKKSVAVARTYLGRADA